MDDQDRCTWPLGECKCAAMRASADKSPDRQGRVWMHCESGLTLTKASMGRFMNFVLANEIEIGTIWPFAPQYPRSQVCVTVRLRPDQFDQFEAQTGGTLIKPPKIVLNQNSVIEGDL